MTSTVGGTGDSFAEICAKTCTKTRLHPPYIRQSIGRNSSRGVLFVFTAATILFCSGAAQSGPCTTQIDQLQRELAGDTTGPNSGATATQSVGAQLHHQPTPGSIGQAAHAANADGDLAIDRAKKADVAGDAAGCNQALTEARRLYDVDQ
jgi:hypothetical protein